MSEWTPLVTLVVTASLFAAGSIAARRWLAHPDGPSQVTFWAHFSPHGVDLSGYGWPPNSVVHLSVWNEPMAEDGIIYNSPPRVLLLSGGGAVRTGAQGELAFTMPFPRKVAGRPNPEFRDVFFLACIPKRRIFREARLDSGSALWLGP